jgi:UDP-glucose 4-epimerase
MLFLITGGAGFIGSHLVEELLRVNHQIIVVDNLSTGKKENLPQHPNLTFIHKDILQCQPEDLPPNIDGIAHLAATASVPTSWFKPLEAHENNLSATVWVIELCQRLNIPRLVYTSSAAVYGEQTQLPIQENQITQPIAPYGWQKLFSEQYASLFAQRIGFSFVGLRLFNVYGPRQLPDSSYSGVISIFIDAMRKGLPITIYGDGSQTRDFIFVKDVANALASALTIFQSPGSSLVCNIGTGISISLLDLIYIAKVCFPQWEEIINFEKTRLGDIQHSLANIHKAQANLNFTPQYSTELGINSLAESILID